MDEGRKQDIKELEVARQTAPDKETLHNINKVERTIKDEQHDGFRRSAREALVKAARTGRNGNIQDVQETIKKSEGKGIGKTSFLFSLPWKK